MNEKIKAQWMAQYLGQHCFLYAENHTENDGGVYDVSSGTLGISRNETSCLLLRTVNMLTDEEVTNIANMYGWDATDVTKERFDERVLQFKIDLPCIEKPGFKHRHLKFVFDYLIRIGILLSFTYLCKNNKPQTLTPAEILKLGWAKIKTEKTP